MQQDIRMDVIIIVTHRDMFTGEDMTTGTILTGLISVRCTTTDMITTNGNDTTTAIGDIAINFC